MLSTALEASGLAVLTAGCSIALLLLAGPGWAILALGLLGGGSLLFVGFALDAPEPGKRLVIRATDAPLTNGRVESV
jgi:hypothetical protein